MNLLLNNWNLKITALIIAVFLWGHVLGQVNPWEVMPFRVPLEVNLPDGATMNPHIKLPRAVAVMVQGPRRTLDALKSASMQASGAPFPLLTGQVRAELNLENTPIGTQTVPVDAITELRDLDIVSTSPSEVQVDIRRGIPNMETVQP